MVNNQPVSVIADKIRSHNTRLWRFIQKHVKEDSSGVEKIDIDETSKKRHNYNTVVIDLNKKTVV